MKSYIFKVVLEQDKWPDEPNEAAVWRAYVPALAHKGAASWGQTQNEALDNLRTALEMVIGHLRETGQPIPETPSEEVTTSDDPVLAVNA